MGPANIFPTGIYYLNPDVIGDLSNVQCDQVAPNRIRVFGTKGTLATSSSNHFDQMLSNVKIGLTLMEEMQAFQPLRHSRWPFYRLAAIMLNYQSTQPALISQKRSSIFASKQVEYWIKIGFRVLRFKSMAHRRRTVRASAKQWYR